MVYLCGDNHIEKETDSYLASFLGSAPNDQLHLVIQYDKAEGAKRYLLPAGSTQAIELSDVRRDVNTGAPEALSEFLEWAIQNVSADHHILVFSGLGINPRYVRQSLRLDDLPKPLQRGRGGQPGDPNLPQVRDQFLTQFETLTADQCAQYRSAIHNRTFSICHDFSNSGSLEASDMREVLQRATTFFPKANATRAST